MKNELMTNLTEGIIDELHTGNAIGHISNGLQNVINGKSMITANKEVDIARISAQERVIAAKIHADTVSKHDKAELAKSALKTVETMSQDGSLTDTKMLAIFNFVIATNNDL